MSSQHPMRRGFTLIEVLIALVILLIVFLVTSSGIVSALRTYNVQESATSSQSKMRRVTEVVTQELRGAVLGGISNYPVESSTTSVSFMLLAGTGGLVVLDDADWGTAQTTRLFAPNLGVIEEELVNRPGLIVNGNGEALIMPNISGVYVATSSVGHAGCAVSISHTPNTQLFGARALGFRYDAGDNTLYLRQVEGGSAVEVPFAFNLTNFELEYQYVGPDNSLQLFSTPQVGVDGAPLSSYEVGEAVYDLARLKLTMATDANGGRGAREYVSFVEMTGVGGVPKYATMIPCEPPDVEDEEDEDDEDDEDDDNGEDETPPGDGGWK